jgi:hypothetical protein
MDDEYPFIVHACKPTIGEDPFLTHTHGLEDVGMLEMVCYKNEEIDARKECNYINQLYDFYYENNDVYKQFLLQGTQVHHMHPEDDIYKTNLIIVSVVEMGSNEMIKDAYEGMDVENKKFILLNFITGNEKSMIMMDRNINRMK